MTFIKTRSCSIVKGADGHYYLHGVMSDDKVDRDGDRMSTPLLHSWANLINTEHINIYLDHKHGIEDIVGVWNKADVVNGRLVTEARLEDPEINPKVAAIIHKINSGERVGISIGGDLTNSEKEYDGRSGQTVRRITNATLYEASLVGIPSNPNAYVEGVVFKSWKPLFDKVTGTDSNPLVRTTPYANLDNMKDVIQNTPIFMQPEGKIAAEPGMSGSSEVFRTDTGAKPPGPISPQGGGQALSAASERRLTLTEEMYEDAAKNFGLSREEAEQAIQWKMDREDESGNAEEAAIADFDKWHPTDLEKSTRQLAFQKDVYNWPSVIALDFNGTVSLQGRGGLIKIEDIKALQAAGKTVFIFTSSVDADSKEAMRSSFAREGILYTDDEDLLRQADLFVGDKRSDERKAGKYGIKFVNVEDFDLNKLLSKHAPAPGIRLPSPDALSNIVNQTVDALTKQGGTDYYTLKTPYAGDLRPDMPVVEEETIPGRNKTLPSEFSAPVFNRRGVDETKSFDKHAWQGQIDQQNLASGAVQDATAQVRQMEAVRDLHERLHGLGQPHDQTICRHCTGKQPSALDRPRPAPPLETNILSNKGEPRSMRPGGAQGYAEEDLSRQGVAMGRNEENGRELTGNPAARAEGKIKWCEEHGQYERFEEEDIGAGAGVVGRGPRFTEQPGSSVGFTEEDGIEPGTDTRLGPVKRHFAGGPRRARQVAGSR
jgi:hypothetical protein